MKTFKVIYSEANKPGNKVIIVQAPDADMAKIYAKRELTGTFGSFSSKYSFWEVKEI